MEVHTNSSNGCGVPLSATDCALNVKSAISTAQSYYDEDRDITGVFNYRYLIARYLNVYAHYFGRKDFDIGELINQVMNLVVRLSDCNSMVNFVFAVVSFIKDYQGITYKEFHLKYEGFLFNSLLAIFAIRMIRKDNKYSVAQSSTKEARNFLDQVRFSVKSYNKIRDSEFGQKFCNLCTMIILSPFCVKMGIDSTWFGFSEIFHKRLQYERKNTEHFDLIYETIDTTSFLLEKLTMFLDTGSYHFLYVDDLEVAEYEASFEMLSHYSDKFALLANQGMTVRDYLNEVDKTIERGKKLKDFYASDRFKSAALKSQQASLSKFKFRAYDKLQVNSKRDAPIAFCLFGPPGIGKSALIDKILHGLYLNDIALGVTAKRYDPDMKYIFNEDDEYMSEFKASHEICVMDDVDQFNDNITEMREGGSIAKSIYFINPVPYVTAQAALEDKGMIPFLCRYVVMTTNTYDAGISKVFRKEGGAFRRFVFIEIKVKPEYRKAGQTQLQGDMDEDGYMNHEMHEFWVRKYISNGPSSSPVYWDKVAKKWSTGGEDSKYGMSLAELLLFYNDEIQKPHYKQCDITKKSLDHFFSSNLCPNCHVPDVLCKCSEAQCKLKPVLDGMWDRFRAQEPEPMSNWYTTLIMWYVGFWYALHIVLQKLWYGPKPSFATHKLIDSVELLPSEVKPPAVVRYLPRFIKTRILCENWIPFVTDYVRQAHGRGLISFSAARRQQMLYVSFGVAGITAILGVLLNMYKSYRSLVESEAQHECKPHVEPEEAKKENVWTTNFVPLTKVEGPPSTTTFEQLVKLAEFNTARFVADGMETNIFFITANKAVMPRHSYKSLTFPIKVNILFSPEADINLNRKNLLIDSHNFVTDTGMTDLVLFHHNSIVPRRDLSKYLLDKTFRGKGKGIMIPRGQDGVLRPVPVQGFEKDIVYYKFQDKESIVLSEEGYVSWSKVPTIKGDCGSPYIIQAGNGCFIAGVHISGRYESDWKMYRAECHRVLIQNIVPNDERFEPLTRNGLDLKEIYETDRDLSLTQSIHPKDPIMEMHGSAAVYGVMESFPRRKMKTQVDRTLMAEDVKEYYKLDNYTHFSPASINSRAATVLNVQPMLDKPSFPQNDVYRAEDALFTWYMREIKAINRPFPVGPFDIDVGINGYDGVQYVDRLPVSTSTGFPHGGAKLKHLVDLEPQEGHAVRRGLDDVLQIEYDRIKACYLRGERSAIVFDSNFKDEPVSQSKIDKNKCRIFNAGPCAFTVLFRQYYLWCIPYFSGRNRHKFAMAIGANAYNLDWKNLFEHVTRHGKNRVIAGDYSNFDKRMSAQMMCSAFNVLIKICKRYGWSEEDLLIMRGLATDVCYPLTNVFGLLLEFEGSNPSGHPLTTVINGMCNIMYMMLACMDIEREKQVVNGIDYNFFLDYFSLLTYGDDNFGSANKDYPYINHTNISNALAKYEVIYTMADKNSESRPFINVTEADFLKRKFIENSHFNGHVAAPLTEESIIKMLTTIVVSRDITLEEQCAAVIESANREYFQYGQVVYDEKRDFLLTLVDKYGLYPYLSGGGLPTYQERLTALKASYGISEAQSYEEWAETLPTPISEDDWHEIVETLSDYDADVECDSMTDVSTITFYDDEDVGIVFNRYYNSPLSNYVPFWHIVKYRHVMDDIIIHHYIKQFL